ncbi:MAG: DUF421 domain-containing protein [Dethiobacter sp.]|nr:DUF421 domain-containing protein [Dethiobacter sp.]
MTRHYNYGRTHLSKPFTKMITLLKEALVLGGRAVVIYFLVLVMVKLMGKREVGQLTPLDFVVGIMIGSVAALPMEDAQIPFLPAMVPIVVLAGLEIIFSVLALNSKKIRLFVEDKPTIIISDGRLIKENMAKTRMNIDDLKQELRKQGVADINEVEEGTLETGGTFSVIKKKEYQPLTLADLQATSMHNLDQVIGVFASKARRDLQALLDR